MRLKEGMCIKSFSIQALLKSFFVLVKKGKILLINYWILHLSDLFHFQIQEMQ